MILVNSTNIHGVHYNPETNQLSVTFKNKKTYVYNHVPEETYNKFLSAPSKTTFLKAHIHNKHVRLK